MRVSVTLSLKEKAASAARFVADIAQDDRCPSDIRTGALAVIHGLGPAARSVSPVIAKCLQDEDSRILMSALIALEETGVTVAAVPVLVEALNYRDPKTGVIRNRHPGMFHLGGLDMHEMVVEMLIKLGSDARSAVPTLEELLRRDTSESDAQRKLREATHNQIAVENEPILAEIQRLDSRQWRRKQQLAASLREAEQFRGEIRLTSEEAKAAAEKALQMLKEKSKH
jgi:hypothetical protein